jgi:hypothetical protein
MAARKRLEEEIKVGLISAFLDIHTRLTDGFDHDGTSGFGDIPLSGTENIVLRFTRASDPDRAICAFNSHSILTVVQVEQFAGAKEQFDSWGL